MTAPTDLYRRRARVRRVVDGDTFDITVDLGFGTSANIRVRLARANTPEVRGATRVEGLAATEAVKDWFAAAARDSNFGEWPIVVETHKAGKFNRWVAEVWSPGGVNLSDWLLEAGLAEPHA